MTPLEKDLCGYLAGFIGFSLLLLLDRFLNRRRFRQ